MKMVIPGLPLPPKVRTADQGTYPMFRLLELLVLELLVRVVWFLFLLPIRLHYHARTQMWGHLIQLLGPELTLDRPLVKVTPVTKTNPIL
jgi:hypothetical protein